MSDITLNSAIASDVLNTVARDILGVDTSGVSSNSAAAVSTIHMVDGASGTAQLKAQALLENWDTLTVTASSVALTVGDADPVVTCADAAISGDGQVGYCVLLDGALFDSGNDTLVGGEAELTLVSPTAGTYDVYVWRQTGDYASGQIQIVVSEA